MVTLETRHFTLQSVQSL